MDIVTMSTPSKEAIEALRRWRTPSLRATPDDQPQDIKSEIAQGEKERQDNKRDIAEFETERWQRRAAEAAGSCPQRPSDGGQEGLAWKREIEIQTTLGLCVGAFKGLLFQVEVPIREKIQKVLDDVEKSEAKLPELKPTCDLCGGEHVEARCPSDGGQEWTLDYVASMYCGKRAFRAIADAHKASLAAWREEIAIIGRSRDAWKSQVTNLSEALAAEREEREQMERCEVCNSELSQCGPQGIDGEPSLDCQVCKLRELLAAEREEREQAERDALTPIAQTLDDDDVYTDSELGVSVIRSEALKQLRKQLDAAIDGWASESQRADDAEAACGENCKTIAKLMKELAAAADAPPKP